MKALVALTAIAMLLVGCGHTETHQAMLRQAQVPTGRPVELYMADQPTPDRPFYELALVQAIGFGTDAHPEDVARALTSKAGLLGCDAVVRTSIDIGYSRAHAAGVCVKWLAPGPSAPTAILPPDPGKNPKPPPIRQTPAPKLEPLPSAPPGSGNGR